MTDPLSDLNRACSLELEIFKVSAALGHLRLARAHRLMQAHRRGRCLRYQDAQRALSALELAHQAFDVAEYAVRRFAKLFDQLHHEEAKLETSVRRLLGDDETRLKS